MRLSLAFMITVLGSPALAHIGHLGEVAGHGHWIALGGIAIAAGIAILGARNKPADADQNAEEGTDEAPEDGEPA